LKRSKKKVRFSVFSVEEDDTLDTVGPLLKQEYSWRVKVEALESLVSQIGEVDDSVYT
jgi:hypothetical protein